MASFSFRGRAEGGCGMFLEGPMIFFKMDSAGVYLGKNTNLYLKLSTTYIFD
jgi:hypothetical protein